MTIISSHSGRRPTTRFARPLLGMLACATIACAGGSEPGPRAGWIAIQSAVPSGLPPSRVSAGERVGEQIVLQVRDAFGRPFRGLTVTATPSHGGSAVSDLEGGEVEGADITDEAGRASFTWTTGLVVGEQTLTLSAPGVQEIVLRVMVSMPWDAKVAISFGDSILPIGGSTLAHANITTAAGEVITDDREFRWYAGPAGVAVVSSGGQSTGGNGNPIVAKGPVTVTAISPGRATITAAFGIFIKVGSEGTISGSSGVAIHPDCTVAEAVRLNPGQSITGIMTDLDCRLESGAPYDTYRLTIPVGQRVQVDLSSSAFDPYLILLDANGTWVTGDDSSGGGTTARIAFSAEAMTYYLQATSLAPGVTGSYTISAQAVP